MTSDSIVTFPGEVFVETADFDQGIRLLLPRYDEMLSAIARCVPTTATRILELGCGTGELSLTTLNHCPSAHLVAIDYSPRMLRYAQAKIQAAGLADRVTWIEADFGDWAIGQFALPHTQFDACISSLAIHHLNDGMKLQLFRQIQQHLTAGGCFWNADPTLPANPVMAEVYQTVRTEWIEQQGTTLEAVQAKLGSRETQGHSSHDHLATLQTHLALLKQAELHNLEVPWKYYGLTLLGGFKP